MSLVFKRNDGKVECVSEEVYSQIVNRTIDDLVQRLEELILSDGETDSLGVLTVCDAIESVANSSKRR